MGRWDDEGYSIDDLLRELNENSKKPHGPSRFVEVECSVCGKRMGSNDPYMLIRIAALHLKDDHPNLSVKRRTEILMELKKYLLAYARSQTDRRSLR